ncbi:peptidase M24 [Clostridia bacterium]|nr:peptidase M24 [Clostridia bacterium]
MSKRKLKGRDKLALKNTRDGAVERNAATGDEVRVSKRDTELDLRGGKQSDKTNFSQVGKSSAKSKNRKQVYRHNRAESADVEQKSSIQETPADNAVQSAPKPNDNAAVQSQAVIADDTHADEMQHPAQSTETGRVPYRPPSAKSKPPPNRRPQYCQNAERQADAVTPTTTDNKPLKHEAPSKLNVDEPAAQTQGKSKQARQPLSQEAVDSDISVNQGDSAVATPSTETPLKQSEPSNLRFTRDDTAVPPEKPKQHRQPVDKSEVTTPDTPPSRSHTTPPDTPSSSGAATSGTKSGEPLKHEHADAPLKADKPDKFRFTDDESSPQIPSRGDVKQQKRYGKAQKQADKAVTKLDNAKSKLPAKKKVRSKRVFNEETGKSKRKLYFESEVKSQAEHLRGSMPLRPVKAAGNSALAFWHRKMFQVEQENVGTEAAHKGEMTAEGVVRSALRHHKTAPYRKVQKLERKVTKKTVNAAYQKTLAQNPKLASNPLSRAFQKRKIKKDYAKSAREAKKTAERAKKAGSAVSSAGKAIVGAVKRHPIAAAVIVLIALLLFALMSLIGAFGGMGSGGLGGILTASYLAEDADIDNAELVYTEWETDLQTQIANAESSHPGYDEYRYNVGEISHNPYELMAYLTVKHQNFSYAAVESDLRAIFAEQYNLTFTPTTETRYRTVTTKDPETGETSTSEESYEWHVMTVSLAVQSFSDVAMSHLSGEDYAHYALLLQTKGSRQYIANPFGDVNWLPYVSSYYGYRIHPISGEKNYHKGVDIALPLGTPIMAGQDGTVTFAGYSGDYGNVVVIEGDKGLVSKYAHCDTISVAVGQPVKAGDVIATVGNTGASTGAHLHLEIISNGQYLNPIFFADTGSFSLTPSYGYAGEAMGDGTYAALMAEAEKYLGYPYVWGGSSPSTSFDCSGYVSYVLVHSGVKNVGRLGATALYNISTPVFPSDARPGDLVFFHSTYSTPMPVTHVGIYVGTDASGRPRMLHCGNPIQYTYIDTTYWQNHFYAFGRIN